MGFKVFLTEATQNHFSLTYYKLLSALDEAHISTANNRYEFNLGKVVKESRFNKLFVRIQEGPKDVRLGKHSDGRFFIVITTDHIPSRMEIDTMFDTDKELMQKFTNLLDQYYKNYLDDSDIEPNEHEVAVTYDKKKFEESYQTLVDAINSLEDRYNQTLKEIEKGSNTVNPFKRASITLAKDKLRNEYFGNSPKDFLNKMKKLPEADFLKYLDKALKQTLDNRLINYYEQKI